MEVLSIWVGGPARTNCCRASLGWAGGTSFDFAQDRLCPYVAWGDYFAGAGAGWLKRAGCGLRSGAGCWSRFFSDFRKCCASDRFTGTDERGAVLEVVVLESVDVGFNDEVGGLPDCRSSSPARWRSIDRSHQTGGAGRLCASRFLFRCTAEYAVGAHLAQRDGGNGVREHAIDQHASANLYRKEHSGISATGAYRIDERAGMEDHAFAGGEIGRGDGERNAELLEGLHFEDGVEESDHALVEAKPRRESVHGRSV